MYSEYKIESSSMFLNSYNTKRSALHDLKQVNPANKIVTTNCDSVIRQGLLENEHSAANYDDRGFKVLAVARNTFLLCLFETALFSEANSKLLNR